jgi:threonine dehydratase
MNYAATRVVAIDDVRAAAERIGPFVVRTPLEHSAQLSRECGAEVWLKLECFQTTGSFKLRGALNALMLLPQESRQIITASAGNHGLGVAHAARILDKTATVVVPETAARTKIDKLSAAGAELLLVGQTYDDAERAAQNIARERNVPFISPYNDVHVIAGAGTVALEVLEDVPGAKTLVVPAGGGGLISGIGVAAHSVDPAIAVVGVQSVASPALHAARRHGSAVHVEVQPGLADGLSGNVDPASITLGLMNQHVGEIVLVEEHAIAAAMRWLLLHEHVVVEGASAVAIAALRVHSVKDGPVVVVLTGRNTDTVPV